MAKLTRAWDSVLTLLRRAKGGDGNARSVVL